MEIYNKTTESISQGGSRKGALIMSLDIWHKEAADFIKLKSQTGKIQKANLSLEIDDEFMQAVKEYYTTGNTVTKTIKCTYGGDNTSEYEVCPIKLYKLMMQTAYDWAEPGCIFTNRFRNYNMMQYCDDYKIETCNPCGEQPLPKHGACNLGSINLSEFVSNPYTEDAYFNTSDFVHTVYVAVKALDTVIDENLENHALPEQQHMAEMYRNIGLGVMGLHDCLIKLNLLYGSKESIRFVDSLMGLMFRSAVIESVELAKAKGTFPAYNPNLLQSDIIKEHFTVNELDTIGATAHGLRNCSLLSIAPTGTLGTMLNISTGCEPLFALSYQRKTESLNNNQDKYYKVYTGIAQDYLNKYKEPFTKYFNTSADIHWKDRIDIQAALQKHVDTAISSTINLPAEITVDEIEKLYLYAWEQGLKGITIFRDKCKRDGILTTEDNNEKQTETHELKRGEVIECSDDLIGKKRKLTTGCGSLHCLGFFNPTTGALQEVYLAKGSTGGCLNFMNGLSRMISESARAGVSVFNIKDQLDSTGVCPSYRTRTVTKHDTSKGSCCPMAVGNALIDMWKEVQEDLKNNQTEEDYIVSKPPLKPLQKVNNEIICPECGTKLKFTNGCNSCPNCGYSRCD